MRSTSSPDTKAEAVPLSLTCPPLISLKQYLKPDCWLYVPPPVSVWAWMPPPPGAGAPADPEEEDSVRRLGLNPDTWKKEESLRKQKDPTVTPSEKVGLTFSTWWIFTLASGGCCTLTFTMEGLGAAETHSERSLSFRSFHTQSASHTTHLQTSLPPAGGPAAQGTQTG